MEFESETKIEPPKLYSNWVHKKTGDIYFVVLVTNMDEGDVREKYPPTVVYQSRATSKAYSGRLDDWYRRMEPV